MHVRMYACTYVTEDVCHVCALPLSLVIHVRLLQQCLEVEIHRQLRQSESRVSMDEAAWLGPVGGAYDIFIVLSK